MRSVGNGSGGYSVKSVVANECRCFGPAKRKESANAQSIVKTVVSDALQAIGKEEDKEAGSTKIICILTSWLFGRESETRARRFIISR